MFKYVFELYRIIVQSTRAPTGSVKNTHVTKKSGKIQTRDRKVIKMFLVISLIFLASFLPAILKITLIVDSWFLMYTYFFNHFGNAVVYFMFDNEFRAEVVRLIRKVICD